MEYIVYDFLLYQLNLGLSLLAIAYTTGLRTAVEVVPANGYSPLLPRSCLQ